MTKTDHTITFREITKETLHDILRLQVAPHQQQFVASNTLSLAEAHFEPDLPCSERSTRVIRRSVF